MVVFAIDGFFLDVFQRVVHPAHIPLKPKAQTTGIGWRANTRERRGLLGNHHDPGVALIDSGVGFLKELNCIQVLATTKDIW